ncbi:hypothetical protein E6O75_ATG08370 [Venturia nashicola]|uniref:Extracelular serine carboxypeptidase n=1 Tax=Venturia nashicola TaxID=86259 RepID=A0A4Z1NVN8_9PEZI|nr:hypothetical protein E6O75_ATG08370 [Venturia nashicola]
MLVFNLFSLIGCVAALKSRNVGEIETRQVTAAKRYTVYTIDQPIDHFPGSSKYAPHTNATFKQRYVFDASYYKSGGPVYLYIGGETSLESRLSNIRTGIIQVLMEATNGLGIILENRYYGKSYPFNSSTTDQLAYLTTEQTIADNAYFAQHVRLPGFNASINAPSSPWILYGGSLAGAQTAFSVKAHGDVLYGGIASSAVIQATLAYPEWYSPIQKFGPSDCIASINAIIANFDTLIDSNNTAAVQKFKTLFGLGDLVDNRDFAMTIAFPIGGPMRYPTNTWQELNWSPVYGSDDFWLFCQNVTNPDAPENITQIDYALSEYTNGQPWTNLGNYAHYIKENIIPLCHGAPIDSTACFGTQNETYYARTANSGGRSYLYSTCAEQGAYQVAPSSGPSLISKVLQVSYTQQWCTWAFPPGTYNSIPSTPDLSAYNLYGGFNISADRLAFIDGNVDVWKDVCYHSSLVPERVSKGFEDETLHPHLLITGAGHHWDSYAFGYGNISSEPQFIREAHLWEIRSVKRWLGMFDETKGFGKGKKK